MSILCSKFYFKPAIKERMQNDRTEGSKFLVKSSKAQISALLISMNQEYLTLTNITLFDDVIDKYLDPTSSQFVVVALGRACMVYGNKFLWELLVFKKLWSIAQKEN